MKQFFSEYKRIFISTFLIAAACAAAAFFLMPAPVPFACGCFAGQLISQLNLYLLSLAVGVLTAAKQGKSGAAILRVIPLWGMRYVLYALAGVAAFRLGEAPGLLGFAIGVFTLLFGALFSRFLRRNS